MSYYPGGVQQEVNVNSRIGRPYLLMTNGPQEVPLSVEFSATEIMANIQMPVNIGIAIDRSGSMKGENLDQAIQGACNIIQQMKPTDIVSVIAFDDQIKIIAPAQPVFDPARIIRDIKKIKAGGSTDIGLALASTLAQVSQQYPGAPVMARRIILLTDGYTNEGTEYQCQEAAEQIGKAGIPLFTLGLGSDWNSIFMEILRSSNETYVQGGTAEYLPNPQYIVSCFDRIFKSAQAAVVSNLQAVLRLSLGVTPIAVYRIFPLISDLGYQPISDREISVNLGDLEKGNGQTLLFRMTVPARPAGPFRLGQIEARFDIPLLGVYGKQVRQDLVITVTPDQSLTSQVDPQVMNLAEKVRAFKLQTIALKDLDQGNKGSATIKLKEAVTILLSQGEQQQASAIQAELQNLQQGGDISAEGEKTIRFNKSRTIRF